MKRPPLQMILRQKQLQLIHVAACMYMILLGTCLADHDPVSFRPGSGTTGSQQLPLPQLPPTALEHSTSRVGTLRTVSDYLPYMGFLSLLTLMYPGRWHRQPPAHHPGPPMLAGGKAAPPAWSPAWKHYPLRRWLRDFNMWLNMTEFAPAQAATALAQVLQDEAREMCNEYHLPALTNGRIVNGAHVDPSR